MPAPFFVFRDAGAGNRGVGIPGGIWGFRDTGRCSGFRGGGCVGAAMRASVWRGKEGARSEDCPVLGRLLGTRKTAGHSEDCRTLGGRERGLWELVRVSGAACKRLGGELSGIAGGEGLLAANCRGRRGGVSGRGPLESEGVGCLEAICLAGISLDAGKGLRMRRVAGCSGVGYEAGRGCSGLCRELKPRESGV